MEKQILEMADDIRRVRESYFGQADYLFAKKMYEDGYRKASDVAREIFAEIEKIAILNGYISVSDFYTDHPLLAELKKKYESEGENR